MMMLPYSWKVKPLVTKRENLDEERKTMVACVGLKTIFWSMKRVICSDLWDVSIAFRGIRFQSSDIG
jgi:hypothetical protein